MTEELKALEWMNQGKEEEDKLTGGVEGEKVAEEGIEPNEEPKMNLEYEDAEDDEELEIEEIKTVIEKSDKSFTVKKLVEMIKQGKVRLDLLIQRDYVWNELQKSLLIDSMIAELPIAQIWSWDKDRDGIMYIIDGKQRLTTMTKFINNEFPIYKKALPVLGQKIAKLYFRELSPEFQETILDTVIGCKCLIGTEEYLIPEIIRRLNEQNPMSKFQKLRTEMKKEHLEFLMVMAEHPLMDRVSKAVTRMSKNRKEELIVKFIMANAGELDFKNENMRTFLESIPEGFPPEAQQKVQRQMDLLSQITLPDKTIKNLMKINATIALTQVVPSGEFSIEKFGNTVELWFTTASDAFRKSLNQGTLNTLQARQRVSMIREYFEERGFQYE